MSALQSIDTAAFRFVNETLVTPFFDEVMPILSGGRVSFACNHSLAANF